MSQKSSQSKGRNTAKAAPYVLRHWLKRISILLLKLTLVLVLVLVFYLVYLDSKISKKFAGQKWQVPAQIYARSMELLPGKALTQQQLIVQLDNLQYQRNAKLDAPGQYSVSRNHVSIYRRPFTYIDGYEAAMLFSVEFNRGGINRIMQRQQKEAVNFARLEPQLIEHLVAAQQEDRELVQLQQVPELFKDTLLLVEDRDFYHHHGVSPLSVIRAFWVNLVAGRTVQGGSTLTQQLAKNMFLSSDRTLWRKANEALIALVLDYRFNKDQILEAYLNEVFVGQNYANAVHGVGLGSRFYFGKPLTELQPADYALLIGILKGPSYFDPRRYPERAQQRRDLVLRLMFEQHLLDRQQYEQAVTQPLAVIPRGKYLNAGYAAYIDAVKKELRLLSIDAKHQDQGIKVFTHLDTQAQRAVELAVAQQLAALDPDLQAAVVLANYKQAEIIAMLGSKDAVQGGFNRAIDARRQIGSIIKPVIYLEALAQRGRYTLATLLQDEPIRLRSNDQDWQPQNFDKQHRGQVTLLDALANSLNVPTVRLGLQLGLPAINEGLRKLGLVRNVKLHPAALLGAVELSPLEVSQLYQTIANNGLHQQLSTLQAVTDNNGHPLYLRQHQLTRRYHEQEVYLLQHALIQAAKTGTAKQLQTAFPGVIIAGKTGTSSDYRDSWFSGFDQDTVSTIWLGRDDNKAIGLTGSTGALNVFSRYHRLQGVDSIVKPMPEQVSLQAFSINTGYPQAENCLNVLLLPAISVEMPVMSECTEE
ncbi:penicillin-binding protein 1B [Rheinheimera maricola]|uniref:Penicillin-binding protein 1B n=1 Tax=Rheinheimera maricola TaxID=2793282 RepID=A0ABS7X6G5_9GAMM|nr:penicillin-binding protein 1B [Rheinheimera maricola]MBZ9611138.1 penicillin-binding protein 1B [Rheinheimera maricola]